MRANVQKAAVERELRWWIERGAELTKKQALSRLRQVLASMASGRVVDEAGYTPKVTVVVSVDDPEEGEYWYDLHGEYFTADLEFDRSGGELFLYTRDTFDKMRVHHVLGDHKRYTELKERNVTLFREHGKLRFLTNDFSPAWRSVVRSEVGKVVSRESSERRVMPSSRV